MSMADDLEGGATTRGEFFTQARRAKQSSRSQQRRHAPERQASLRTDAEFKKSSLGRLLPEAFRAERERQV